MLLKSFDDLYDVGACLLSLNIEFAIIDNAQASNACFGLGHEVSERHRIIRRDVERLAGYAYAGQGCDDVSGWLFTHYPIMHLKFVVRQRSQQLPVGHTGFVSGVGAGERTMCGGLPFAVTRTLPRLNRVKQFPSPTDSPSPSDATRTIRDVVSDLTAAFARNRVLRHILDGLQVAA
jgi:hypothetical protein